jgi:hypothetical protein
MSQSSRITYHRDRAAVFRMVASHMRCPEAQSRYLHLAEEDDALAEKAISDEHRATVIRFPQRE